MARPAAGVTVENANHIHFMADGAAIYTLSAQGPSSEMKNNYIHDYAQSIWADFQIAGIYLNEGTTGYTVSDNMFVNATSAIFQNHTETNILYNSNSFSQQTVDDAGLEP